MAAPINVTGGPRFDLPRTTRPASDVVRGLGISLLDQQALPEFTDPPAKFDPMFASDESLVHIRHRNIRILSNYWHAGWARSFPEMQLRSGAADALYKVADSLPERFGLAVFDAYRPLELQAELYEAAYADPALPPGFVAEPLENIATPPPHSTGGTVDLTLTVDGTPLSIGTDFDDFSDLANTRAFEDRPGHDRDLRRLLYWHMRAGGFIVLHCEWWHFEYGTRRWGAIRNKQPFYGRVDL